MSWVSQANIKTIMTAIRNKFTTSDLVIANDAKDTGVELNYASQDGLVTVSPISTSASTEAALHLSNGDDTKKTELTQGTLSYVTGTGSSETYNYMSLLGDGVTFGKNGGGNVQVGGVADPTSAQQVATKKYSDSITKKLNAPLGTHRVDSLGEIITYVAGSAPVYHVVINIPSTYKDFETLKEYLSNPLVMCCWNGIHNRLYSYPDPLFLENISITNDYIALNGVIISTGSYTTSSDIAYLLFYSVYDRYTYS